ncbi:MAG TPA: hypothetical protein VMR96_09265 [Solirubrobacterales bacterium]|nr:hypothetical protein [Solirubrobacterales bacterium]
MAINQREIERKLEDGFVLGWDTTEVPDELRKTVRQVADGQIKEFFKLVESRQGEPPVPHRESA